LLAKDESINIVNLIDNDDMKYRMKVANLTAIDHFKNSDVSIVNSQINRTFSKVESDAKSYSQIPKETFKASIFRKKKLK